MNPLKASYASMYPLGEAQSRQSHPRSLRMNLYMYLWNITIRVILLANTVWTLHQLSVDNLGELSGLSSAVEFVGH